MCPSEDRNLLAIYKIYKYNILVYVLCAAARTTHTHTDTHSTVARHTHTHCMMQMRAKCQKFLCEEHEGQRIYVRRATDVRQTVFFFLRCDCAYCPFVNAKLLEKYLYIYLR